MQKDVRSDIPEESLETEALETSEVASFSGTNASGEETLLDDLNTPNKGVPSNESITSNEETPSNELVASNEDALLESPSTTPPLPTFLPEPPRTTVLVVHASVGSGHRSAAKAVGQALEMLRDSEDLEITQGCEVPKNLKIEVLDILDYGRIPIDGNKTASMFTGATRPFYDLTWRYTFTGRLLWGGGTIWNRIMFPRFTQLIKETRPLAVICTHITAANATVGARMLTGDHFPILCVPTDYETEGLWPHLHTDMFCVANESMAETLRPRKVPEDRIRITGIPTRPAFRETYDREQVRKEKGLPLDKQIVLVLAGAYLPQPYVRFREALDKALPYVHSLNNMHLVFIAGRDSTYSNHLRRECEEYDLNNMTVLDYVEDIAALMAASDLVVCKSGGLTVTECLCSQVPMILLGRAYGQEKVNVITLTSLGAAMHVTTPRELVGALKTINENPQSARSMLVNGSYLRKPDAALDIARAAFELAKKEPVLNDDLRRKHFVHFYWGGRPAHTR